MDRTTGASEVASLCNAESAHKSTSVQALIDSLPVALVTLDTNLSVSHLNVVAQKECGITLQDALGLRWNDLLESRAPEADTLEQLQGVLEGRYPSSSIVIEMVDACGNNSSGRWHVTPVSDDSGVTIGLTCMANSTTVASARIDDQSLQASFVKNNPAPVLMLDSRGVVHLANEAAFHVLGFCPQGSYVWDIFESIPRTILTNPGNGVTRQYDQEINGRVFQFTVKYVEQAASIYVFGTDITRRKRAEQCLKDSEHRLRSITNAAHDAVVTLDCEGCTTYWNAAAEKIFGYNCDQIMGLKFHETVVPADSIDVFTAALKEVQESGSGATVSRTLELEAVRMDGNVAPVEVSLSPLQVGSEWHCVGIMRETSDRTARDEAHDKTVAGYMAMINTVPAMMFLKDIDHRYVMVNKAFCNLVQRPLQEIVGKTAFDLADYHLVASQHELESKVMDEDKPYVSHDERFTDPDGNERWTSTTTVPIHDMQGLVAGVVGLVQDETELHFSREKLIQADKMAAIGTLAAGVAHEINNPVGFISSNLNTMQKYVAKVREFIDGDPDEDARKMMDDILEDFGDAIEESLDGADRVKKIVADLKGFSRVDKSQKEFFNINDGLETTLNIVWNELKYKCTVEKEYGDIPELFCIPNQLNQVFMNLLVNAGHAIHDESGIITIATHADAENIYVSISDNGMGIPRENLKRIFEPFFTTKEIRKGTGLGLSMTYDIVTKHNGRIEVESEVGAGTEFLITLPLEGLDSETPQHPAG